MSMEANSNDAVKPVIIAIIDSGIDMTKTDISRHVLRSTGFSLNERGIIVEDAGKTVGNEHGTAIALIIRHLCREVAFISVNILDQNLRADGRVLLHAMRQALAYKPDIVHMSLGTTRWRYKPHLMKLVREAWDQNCLMVAAAHNKGLISYPAYLKGVLGVRAARTQREENFYYREGFLYAPYSTHTVPGMSELDTSYMEGSSMSAAYISGYIAKLKVSNPSLTNKGIIRILRSKGENTIEEEWENAW